MLCRATVANTSWNPTEMLMSLHIRLATARSSCSCADDAGLQYQTSRHPHPLRTKHEAVVYVIDACLRFLSSNIADGVCFPVKVGRSVFSDRGAPSCSGKDCFCQRVCSVGWKNSVNVKICCACVSTKWQMRLLSSVCKDAGSLLVLCCKSNFARAQLALAIHCSSGLRQRVGRQYSAEQRLPTPPGTHNEMLNGKTHLACSKCMPDCCRLRTSSISTATCAQKTICSSGRCLPVSCPQAFAAKWMGFPDKGEQACVLVKMELKSS